MSHERIYLIDATAFCYRAFYALPALATSSGQPTGAVYGFTTMLQKILKKEKPQYLAICFDVSRDTFRQKKFAEYKIDRPSMPDTLSSQMPLIKEVVRAYGCPIVEKEGFEADDVIASLRAKALDQGAPVTIISSDKDILQLVDAHTVVFSPQKDAGTTYDEAAVKERFGVEPKYIPDVLALMGDSIDNIPGLPGIGEKTATNLIKEFGTLENVLSGIGRLKQEKLRASLSANAEKARFNKELTVLDEKVDLGLGLEDLKVGAADTKALFRLFKDFEFKRLLNDLPSEPAPEPGAGCAHVRDDQLPDFVDPAQLLYVYYQDKELSVRTGKGTVCCDEPGEAARKVLGDPKIRKAGFDLKKIKVALARDGIETKGIDFDLMLAAYLVNPARPEYSMAQIYWDYLPEMAGVKEISPAAALEVMPSLQATLSQELKAKSLEKLFRTIEMPLVEVLSDMELTGIKLDVPFLQELSHVLEQRLITLISDIYALSGSEFNINSPKQLGTILFEHLKLPVIKRTKTGYSTDEEVLRRLAGSHKLPALLLEYRQLTKLKSTYIDALPLLVDPASGRVHTCFHQTGTETGRLSSSNPNLQNIPVKTDIGSKIRKAIIAFSGDSSLVSFDYSQIELRVLAHLSGDSALTEAFHAGKDIHKATAALIFGVAEKDVTGLMRDTAKRVNFGIVYGLTAFGLSRDMEVPAEEAQAFIDAYFTRYPKVKDYIDSQIKRARKDGFVTTILGRRRYLADINNKNQSIRQFSERQAVNTPIQGSASDLIKMAMIAIHNDLREKKLAASMILQIHDELLFDVPQAELSKVFALVKDRMEHVMKLDVPVVVSAKKGKNWLEMEDIE